MSPDRSLNPYKVAHLATTEPEAREAAEKVAARYFLSDEAFDQSLVSVVVPKDDAEPFAVVKIATALGLAELRFLPSLALAPESRQGPLQARVALSLLAGLVGVLVAGLFWDRYTHRHPWFAIYGTGPLALGLGLVAAILVVVAVLGFLRAAAARTWPSSVLLLGLAAAGFVAEVLVLSRGQPSSTAAKAALERGDKERAASEASAVVATRGHDPVADDVLDALHFGLVKKAPESMLKVNHFRGDWFTVSWKDRARSDLETQTLAEAAGLAAKKAAGPLRDLKFIVKSVDETLSDQIAGQRLRLMVDECLAERDFACAELVYRTEEPDGFASERAAVRNGIATAAQNAVDFYLVEATQAQELPQRREAHAYAYHAAQWALRFGGNDKAHPLPELLEAYRAAHLLELTTPGKAAEDGTATGGGSASGQPSPPPPPSGERPPPGSVQPVLPLP